MTIHNAVGICTSREKVDVRIATPYGHPLERQVRPGGRADEEFIEQEVLTIPVRPGSLVLLTPPMNPAAVLLWSRLLMALARRDLRLAIVPEGVVKNWPLGSAERAATASQLASIGRSRLGWPGALPASELTTALLAEVAWPSGLGESGGFGRYYP